MAVVFATEFGPGFVAEPMYEGMFFPAGEAHVKLLEENERLDVGPLTQYARVDTADANDLMQVAMWAQACQRRGEKTVLYIPYLPGARADHSDELIFGADVYADFINSMMIDKIVTFDPHSPIMPKLINNITVIDSTRLIRQHVVGHAEQGLPQRYQGIIAPDKGAVERAGKVADACHIPLYKAEKVRDSDTGKLSGFTCEPLPDKGRFLVVDDICDGGGTFMGLAQATGINRDRLGLFVSHGVFSGNAQHLWNYFNEIWTTDSLKTATNIDKPYFFEPGSNGKYRFGQHRELKVNVIPLAKTLKGYIHNEH